MANVIKVTCRSCGQEINTPAPAQGGVYLLTCPYCQGQMKIKYTPKPITMGVPTQPVPASASASSPAPAPAGANDVRHNPTRRFGPNGMGFGAPMPQPQMPTAGFGRLSMVRLGCDKEYFPLKMGDNIVGRKDIAKPSDIQLEGDPTISRRSVQINVSPANGGYVYMLTVLSAANPVILNGKTIAEGQTAPMTIGATLVMGQTILRLEK